MVAPIRATGPIHPDWDFIIDGAGTRRATYHDASNAAGDENDATYIEFSIHDDVGSGGGTVQMGQVICEAVEILLDPTTIVSVTAHAIMSHTTTRSAENMAGNQFGIGIQHVDGDWDLYGENHVVPPDGVARLYSSPFDLTALKENDSVLEWADFIEAVTAGDLLAGLWFRFVNVEDEPDVVDVLRMYAFWIEINGFPGRLKVNTGDEWEFCNPSTEEGQSVGPWIQDPNYDQTWPTNSSVNAALIASLGVPAFYHFEVDDENYGWHNVDPPATVRGDVSVLLGDRSLWAEAYSDDSPPGMGAWSVSFQTYNTVGDISNPSTHAFGQGVTDVWLVKPPAFNTYFPGNSDDSFDDTAIGIEWQDTGEVIIFDDGWDSDQMSLPEWETAGLNPATTLQVGTGGLDGGWEAFIMAGPWAVDDELIGSMTFTQDADGVVALGGDTIDLTSRLASSEHGWLQLHVYSPSVVYPASPEQGTVIWYYGANFKTMQVTWGLRPPVYRYIYAGGVGRLKVNIGDAWKYAVPLPGENEGFGVLKVLVDGEWVLADTPQL